MQSNEIRALVTQLLPAQRLQALADELGVFTRQRKVHLAPLVWILVLGPLTSPRCSWAHLHRLYLTAVGGSLSRSSFYERLNEPLAALMALLLQYALRNARKQAGHFAQHFQHFDKVLALDSSVVALRDGLHQAFESCQKAKSALKLHATVNVLDFRLYRVSLSDQTTSDLTGFKHVKSWCKNKLLLFDLGYYRFSSFAAIDEAGGYFLSRAKTSLNVKIVADHPSGAGAYISMAGLRVKKALKRLQRKQVDWDVLLTWKEQGELKSAQVRLVGVFNEETKRYHLYLTNLPRATYPADELAQMYRARWGVELLFKQLKSDGHLDVQTSAKEHLVRLRIDALLLGYELTGRLCALYQKRKPERSYPVSRGLRALSALVPHLLTQLCEPWANPIDLDDLFERMCIDPNVFRSRPSDPFLRTSCLALSP